jgi:hypothetical protein
MTFSFLDGGYGGRCSALLASAIAVVGGVNEIDYWRPPERPLGALVPFDFMLGCPAPVVRRIGPLLPVPDDLE